MEPFPTEPELFDQMAKQNYMANIIGLFFVETT